MGQHTHPRLDRLQTVSVGNLRRTNLRRSADSSPGEQHGTSSMLEESVTRVLYKRIALAAATVWLHTCVGHPLLRLWVTEFASDVSLLYTSLVIDSCLSRLR